MPVIIEYSGVPSIQDTSEYFLNVLLTVLPASAHNPRRRGKLYVDEVEIDFKRATYSEQAGDAAANITIELADLSDRSAFTRTATVKLESERYVAGVWELAKTYCDGAILATSDYEIQNSGDKPNDTFSVTVKSVLQQKLELTPEQIVVLHDPAKVEVEADSLEVVPNIDGTEGAVTVTPIADMTLRDVLEYVAIDIFGLTGVKTNINVDQWLLTRVDFPAAQPYWGTIQGIIGNHNPRIAIDADDYLVIKDGTLTDYLTARQMTVSDFSRIKLTNTIERYKGCILSQQMDDSDWDYWQFNVTHPVEWFEDEVGQYPKTESEIWEQVFYKNGVATPVDRRTLKEYVFTYADATTITAASGSVFSYANGEVIQRDTREFGLQRVPQSYATANAGYPNHSAGFIAAFGGPEESYTSASDDTFTEAFVLIKTEREVSKFAAHPFESDSMYRTERHITTKGLITVDAENQQLGEDFEQPLNRAQENGNLQEGQGSRWGVTDHSSETVKVLKNRKVNIRTKGTTPLNSPGGGMPTGHTLDPRVGDVGVAVIKKKTSPIFIREGGDPTASMFRSVNGGEAPITITQPLCHRLNKSQDYPGGIDATLPYYDETMSIGLVFDPRVADRDNVSLGIFEVEGYEDVLQGIEEGGFSTKITRSRQIGDGSGAGTLSAVEDTFELNLYTDSATVTQEKLVRCNDGHTLSLVTGAVAGCVVEVKHEDDASWTAIETTPYDLSPFAGSTETFLFRYDPSAATAPQALKFRKGPAA